MPQNFTPSLRDPVTPDSSQPDLGGRDDASGQLLSRAGQYMAPLGEALGYHRDVKALEEFESRSMPNANEYYKKQNTYLEGMASAADEKTYNEYAKQLDDLTAGRDQGVFTPMEVEVRIDNLVKDYTRRLPHLGKQFRATASASKGNGSAAAAEMYGANPILKARNDLLYEAAGRGMKPQELLAERNLLKQNEVTKSTWELLKIEQGLTAQNGYIGLDGYVTSHLAVRDSAIRNSLRAQLQANPKTTQSDIEAAFAKAQLEDRELIANEIAQFQIKNGVAMDSSQQDMLYRKASSFYEIFKKEIDALPTVEQKVKWLEANNKLVGETGKSRLLNWAEKRGDLGVMLAANSPETFNAFVTAAVSTDTVLNRLRKAGDSDKVAYEQFANKYKDNPLMLSMLERHRRGDLDDIVALGIGNIMESGNVPGTGYDVTDLDAKNVTLKTYDNIPYAQRQKFTTNVISGLDFNDYQFSKTLLADIRGDETATAMVLQKATEYTYGHVGLPGSPEEMAIDFSNPNAPFVFKAHSSAFEPGDRAPNSSTAVANLAKVNQTFRTIRDNFGASAAKKWMMSLESGGVKPKWLNEGAYPFTGTAAGGGTRGVRGKVPVEDNETGNVSDVTNPFVGSGKLAPKDAEKVWGSVVQAKEELFPELPAELVHALGEQESGLAKDVLGVKTQKWGRARGPLQIIEAKFNEVNQKWYGGSLDWDNVDNVALAGLTLLNSIYTKHNGDLALTLNEYHSGTPNPGKGSNDGLMNTSDYVNGIMGRMAHWREVLAEANNG